MASTAIPKTIVHYQRPEVWQIITKFCQPAENEWRALNGDEGWYIGVVDTGGIRLRTPDDYGDTLLKYRTMYALLDIFMPSVKTQSTQWDRIKNEPCETLGTLRETVAYTLGADIDSTAHDMKKPEIKAAVEALAGYLVKRLMDAGIEKSVHCLMSGGGIYVLLHHEMCRCPEELIGADREIFFRTRLDAFKMFLADVEHDFYKDHNDLREVVKIDKLTNQKRKFKCICSYHKKLDLAVIPLDPANLVVDFAKAKLPLSDAVLAECASWYSTYASEEQKALSRLLEPYMVVTRETAKNHAHRATMPTTDIPRRPAPLDAKLFPPCMQNIIQHVAPGKGPHRALAVLSTYLYSIGWDDTKAIDVWSLLADKCGVEGRIFDQWYGQMRCPTCTTIKQNSTGYPNVGLGGLGYCVPDPHCKGCVWPGDYHNQKIIADAMKETTGPRFQYVSMASEPDTYGVNPIDGTVCKVFEHENPRTHEYIKSILKISDCAVRIDTETSSDELTEFKFVGKGALDGRTVAFTTPAGDMALPYKFDVAVMNAFGINDLGMMDYPVCRSISLGTRFMTRIEIPGWQGSMPLIPGIELEGIEYKLSHDIPAKVYDGDLGAAKDLLKTAMKINNTTPLLIAAIFGSPIIAKYFPKERFGLGIWGLSNSLKTSTIMALMSVYGVGYNDEPALKSGKAGSTSYAATVSFASAGWLPHLYDNVKAVDPKDAIEYVGTMNAVMEGRSKKQGTTNGKLRKALLFTCLPLVTGEIRPSDAATTSRIPAIDWKDANSDLLREVQTDIALMPVLGYYWLKHIANIKPIDRQAFDKYQAMKMKEFTKAGHTIAGRTATIYTLLKLVWSMLEFSPLGEVFEEFESKFIAALDELAASQGLNTREETESARFMNGLNQLIGSCPANFLTEHMHQNDTTIPVWGKWLEDGIWLMPDAILTAMGKIKIFAQIPTVESMTSALDREGLLIHQVDKDHDRKKWKAGIGGAKVVGWYVPLDTPAKAAKAKADADKAELDVQKDPWKKYDGDGKQGNPENRDQSAPTAAEKDQEKTAGNRWGTAKKYQATPSSPVHPVPPLEETFKEGKIISGPDQKKESFLPMDTIIEGNWVNPKGIDIDIKSTDNDNIGSSVVPPKFPNGSPEAITEEKTECGEPGKEFPIIENDNRICAKCGEDITDHGNIQKGDKFYCTKPGCGYPPRDEAKAT